MDEPSAPDEPEAPEDPGGGSGRRLTGERAALALHVASLAGAFVFILVVDRRMWFRLDDFDFLGERGLHGAVRSVWAPHNEHWSTLPILLWRAIFVFAKLHTARPYLIALYLAHLALAHVLWRVMRATGVGSFVATGLAALFAVLGSGGENILWAFQIGFVSSLLLGWLAVLLLLAGEGGTWRVVAAVAVGVAALMTSAVALTMVVLATAVAAARRGWEDAAAFAVPCAAAFGIWYGLAGRFNHSVPRSFWSRLTLMPAYVARGLAHAPAEATGLRNIWAGTAILVVLTAFAVVYGVRGRRWRSPAAAALFGPAAAVLFFVILAYGRDALGSQEAQTSRYVYIAVALLLPLVGLLVSVLVRRWRAVVTVVALGSLGAAGVWNVDQLFSHRDALVAMSRTTELRLVAAARLTAAAAAVPGSLPLGSLGPNLSLSVLERLYREGALPAGVAPQPADVVAAATQVQLGFTGKAMFSGHGVRVTAWPAGFITGTPPGRRGCFEAIAVGGAGPVRLDVTAPASVRIQLPENEQAASVPAVLTLGGVTGGAAPFTLTGAATWWNVVAAPSVVEVYLPAGVTLTACR